MRILPQKTNLPFFLSHVDPLCWVDMENSIFEILPALELSRESVDELKEIYKEDFGKELSDTEALEMGQRLVRLFQIIYRPFPGDAGRHLDQISQDIDSP